MTTPSDCLGSNGWCLGITWASVNVLAGHCLGDKHNDMFDLNSAWVLLKGIVAVGTRHCPGGVCVMAGRWWRDIKYFFVKYKI